MSKSYNSAVTGRRGCLPGSELASTVWWQRNSGVFKILVTNRKSAIPVPVGSHEIPATPSHRGRSNKKSVQGSKIASPRGVVGRKGAGESRRDPLPEQPKPSAATYLRLDQTRPGWMRPPGEFAGAVCATSASPCKQTANPRASKQNPEGKQKLCNI